MEISTRARYALGGGGGGLLLSLSLFPQSSSSVDEGVGGGQTVSRWKDFRRVTADGQSVEKKERERDHLAKKKKEGVDRKIVLTVILLCERK